MLIITLEVIRDAESAIGHDCELSFIIESMKIRIDALLKVDDKYAAYQTIIDPCDIGSGKRYPSIETVLADFISLITNNVSNFKIAEQ